MFQSLCRNWLYKAKTISKKHTPSQISQLPYWKIAWLFFMLVTSSRTLVFPLNSLNPKSDQHPNFPYSNTAESFIIIMRIKEMIANLRCFDCKTNFPRLDQRRRVEKSVQNMDTDVRVQRVDPLTPKIWLLILPCSCYTFPCKLVMRNWC